MGPQGFEAAPIFCRTVNQRYGRQTVPVFPVSLVSGSKFETRGGGRQSTGPSLALVTSRGFGFYVGEPHQDQGGRQGMKFDLTTQDTGPSGSGSPSEGSADGSFVVMPEAVTAILNEVQTMAIEFNDLLVSADTNMVGLAEASKASPISTELSTFHTEVLAGTIRAAGGRTMVAVGAVNDAVLALIQGDEQMSANAREALALAAQDRVDDAPGAADRQSPIRNGEVHAF